MSPGPRRATSRAAGTGGGAAPPAVDLVQLSIDAALPTALSFQRGAFDVVERIRATAPPGHLTATFAGIPFEVLDLLIFDVLRAGGAGLGAAHLLAAVKPPDTGVARVALPLAAPELRVAAEVLNRRGGAVTFALPDQRVADARRRLFVARHHAQVLRRAGARDTGPRDRVDVVATAQVPHHVHDATAVLGRLRDEGTTVGFVVSDARTAAAVADAGFEVIGGLDLTRAEVARTVASAARLRRRFRRAVARVGDDLDTQAVGAAIDRVLAAQLHLAFAFAASAAPALRGARTQAILTPNPASIAGRATSRIARHLGVPVVGLEHGSIFPDDPRWHDLPVTTMCVWGETSRQALLASGVADRTVAVTGAARFDRPPAVTRVAAPASVLVATSGPGDHVSLDTHLRFIDLLTHAVDQAPPTAWVVKLHPKDDPRLYDRLAERPSVDVVGADRAGRTSIYDRLAAASCLVTVSSTTAIDALRAGVPVLSVWTAGADRPPPFIERSSARVVPDAAALAAGVAEAIGGRLAAADPAFLDEYFAHPGEATVRICAEVRAAMS